jgi:hypothetical protein
MNQPTDDTAQILVLNPQVTLAYLDHTNNPPVLHLHLHPRIAARQVRLPQSLAALPAEYHVGPDLRPLICYINTPAANDAHTACQNEPIKLGTQLQPQGAAWVGTAGAPVRWTDQANITHYGILSNWHVMAMGIERIGHTQHQPDDTRPACATLSRWKAVCSSCQANLVDCAIADALIDGKHTISTEILAVGQPTAPTDATVGRTAIKSGRTTGLTRAVCSAVGAAARVDYGQFSAIFADQDVYDDGAYPFSGPGDSGSLIVAAADNSPLSLLFAGGGGKTIGNPMRHVVAELGLQFPFI